VSRSARPLFVSVLLGFALCAFSGLAHADVDKTERTKDGDYYVFLDDLLNSDVTQPSGGTITVRPIPYRTRLLRPRTSFVMEMFKSVERI
jgi:hypothetical protein